MQDKLLVLSNNWKLYEFVGLEWTLWIEDERILKYLSNQKVLLVISWKLLYPFRDFSPEEKSFFFKS